jgi:hypothetical protein
LNRNSSLVGLRSKSNVDDPHDNLNIMKTKIVLTLINIALAIEVSAQCCGFNFIPPQFIEFATGVVCVSPNYYCLQVGGMQDDVWDVSPTLAFSGAPKAIKANLPPGISWCGEDQCPNSFPNGWISDNFGCNPNSDGYHQCSPHPTVVDRYFRVQFILPANPVLNLDWDICADDRVMGIYVNSSTPVFIPSGTNHMNAAFKFRWCLNWVQGLNTIIVHVRSSSGHLGLKVKAWGDNPLNVSGPSSVCQSSTGLIYSVPSVAGATSYLWSFLPNGWSGSTTSNQVILNAPSTPGQYVLNVSAQNGSGCLGSGTFAVNVLPLPPVNIVPSNNPICPCAPLVLTATGAQSYVWSNQQTGQVLNLSPGPCVPTNYMVTGTDGNGCVNTKQITIGMLPVPGIAISALPLTICPGVQNVLTASGFPNNSNLNWTGPAPNTISGANPSWVLNSPSPGVYNVTVTAPNTCTNSASINLANGAPVTPVVSDQTLCLNAGTCTQVTISTPFVGPATFNWTYLPSTGAPVPLGTGLSMNICPPIPACQLSNHGLVFNYQVTGTSPNGCTASANFKVTLISNCCAQPTTGLTLLPNPIPNGASYTNGHYLVDANTSLSGGGAIFNNCELLFLPDVKLTVPPGAILDLQHVHLYACGIHMWDGIEIMDGGKIITPGASKPTSLIEDAKVAIDLAGTTVPSITGGNTPIAINNVIFNKNYIGIRVRNSGVTHLPLGIWECVFTCRMYPFQNYLTLGGGQLTAASWPNATPVAGGLRFPNGGTNVLGSPYLMQHPIGTNWGVAMLKCPHFPQIGSQYGIKIEDIGNFPSLLPTPGVDIGKTIASSNANDFNLFDNMVAGVHITDASFSTMNNSFQNCRFGIEDHVVATNNMNAFLDLKPIPPPQFQSTNFGNRFWNCLSAVWATNIYKIDVHYGIYRSDKSPGSSGKGVGGLIANTNRFLYDIQQCEFNNIDDNIRVSAVTGPYNVGGTSSPGGTYAHSITINQNYIGPELVSNTGQPATESSRYGITLDGAAASNWNKPGVCNIFSNKLNRVFNGIRVDRMDNYPVEIGGNLISVLDDWINLPGPQYGIYGSDSQKDLIISHNIVSGEITPHSQHIKLIRSERNIGIRVTMNDVSNAHIGFAFEGNHQPAVEETFWRCNQMYRPMDYGFSLENNGIIGQQGSFTLESGNEYLGGCWNPGFEFYTNCIGNSNPSLSQLHIATFWTCPPPVANHHSPITGGPRYVNTICNQICPNIPPSFLDSFNDCFCNAGNDCPYPNTYPATPTQRSVVRTDLVESPVEEIALFPNPSNGNLSLVVPGKGGLLDIRITDIAGKEVYSNSVEITDEPVELKLDLDPAIYTVELYSTGGVSVRKKLVIAD